MREWMKRKKKSRKAKKNSDDYTIADFFFELLFWIPELLILPFRIIYWLARGLGRFISDMW
ncbi:hypothetical protein JOC78_003224 [Bacillus ectoiniformans]|uniref:hypothetical protein n=1 Tax=Bacillus ectoiniformans TaxID=1494429 RepID=UPI001959200A|nr:hypothetical protein [Bacillus ectoiniformans]MBM7650239.1 hypothetical protein [Bacillus ectoiniformans]